MTVKTLTYIHQLLIEDEARRRKAMEIARKAYREAEDTDADNLPDLEDIYQVTRECWNKSHCALAEFENRA